MELNNENEKPEIEKNILSNESSDQLIYLDNEDQVPLMDEEYMTEDNYNKLKPNDRFWLVRWIFLFLGVTVVLPLKFLLNADQYWMYKLRDINAHTQSSTLVIPQVRTNFQVYFTSNLTIAAIVPTTIGLVLSLYLVKWVSAQARMVWSLFFTLIFFAAQTLLFYLNTDQWQTEFFILTMVSVFLMNAARALFQCALLGATSKFPVVYITATNLGQALGGVFAAASNIVNIYVGSITTKSAFFYFVFGSSCILVSLLLAVFSLPSLRFYTFYTENQSNNEKRNNSKYETQEDFSNWDLIDKIWIPTVSCAITWIITVVAYPTLLVIMVVAHPENSILKEKYFLPVMVFLVYALSDCMGRLSSGLLRWPGSKSKHWILILSILRLIIIPIIMTCNLQPRTYLPVFFNTKLQFGIINSIFGFTNGYLVNIIFIVTPQLVTPKEREVANGIVILGLGGGAIIGALLSHTALQIL